MAGWKKQYKLWPYTVYISTRCCLYLLSLVQPFTGISVCHGVQQLQERRTCDTSPSHTLMELLSGLSVWWRGWWVLFLIDDRTGCPPSLSYHLYTVQRASQDKARLLDPSVRPPPQLLSCCRRSQAPEQIVCSVPFFFIKGCGVQVQSSCCSDVTYKMSPSRCPFP